MTVFTNIAAYKFAPLQDLKPLRERLLDQCRAWNLKGTILLSTEGINLFLAGQRTEVELLLSELRSLPGFDTLLPKYSESADQPFRRMLVRIKKEIIAFGIPGVEPGKRTSPKLAPQTLKQWLDEGRPVTLLDTRNDYEVKLGTFKNALTAGIDHFRDFPAAVERLPEEMKEQPIVMFCTGGIRCEKAGPFMELKGFRQIFQLEGGILKYFEECGSEHYEGECFVFDQRVGVDPSLRETPSAQCFDCQTPLDEEDQRDPRYVAGESCPYCFEAPAERLKKALDARHSAIQAVATPLPGSQPHDNYRPVHISAQYDGYALLDMVCTIFPHVAKEEWQDRFERGRMLNFAREPVSPGHVVRAGERYFHLVPSMLEPEVNGDIRILHEDEAILVVNKPAPLPMHPGGRFNRNTLQFILNEVYTPVKPRPAHRLDANTTGVVVFARTRGFAALLQPQFARSEVEKVYLVRVKGHPSVDSFHCEAPIGTEPQELGARRIDEEDGRPARTKFLVVERSSNGTAVLEARPVTGRTNQIRIHLSHLGLPIVGDEVYRGDGVRPETQTLHPEDAPLCLHAWRLSFTHPLSGEKITFEAPSPAWTGL